MSKLIIQYSFYANIGIHRKIFLWSLAVLILSCSAAEASPCDYIQDPISKQNCLSGEIYRENNQQYWNSLSPREQILASGTERLSTEYLNMSGNMIAPNENNTIIVCQQLGCQGQEEYTFVWERLNFLYNARGSMESVCRQLGFASCNDLPGVR